MQHRTASRSTTVASAAAVALALSTPSLAFADEKPSDVFDVQGTKIAGTTSPQDAPTLSVGSYTDDVPVAPGARYYRVKRSPGASIYVSVVSRPAEHATADNREEWRYELATLEGSSCDTENETRSDSYGYNLAVPATLGQDADDSKCGTATDLVLTVKRTTGGQAAAPTELRVIEVPAVKNLDALPGPQTQMPPKLRPPVATDVKEITGGHGFSTATDLGSGTFVTKVRPGEMVFFKTHLDDGQRITYAVDGPTSDFTAWPDGYSSMWVRAQAYNPLRWALDNSADSSYSKSSLADDQVIAAAPVAFRNFSASDSSIRWSSLAGDYYYRLVIGKYGAVKDYDQPIPLKFSVRIDGQKTDGPQFVKGVVPTAGSTASAPATYEDADAPDTGAKAGKANPVEAAVAAATSPGSGGLPAGVWIGLGIAGLALLGGLAYAITRRVTAPRA